MSDDAPTWAARIRRLLPRGWFGESGSTPLLDGILAGLGYAHASTSSWIAFARTQLRLATASDDFLDGLASDFLGARISRASGETDDAFRKRIKREILRPRGTRAAMISALQDLTGQTPLVVEPACTTDTGGWDVGAARMTLRAHGGISPSRSSASSLSTGRTSEASRVSMGGTGRSAAGMLVPSSG